MFRFEAKTVFKRYFDILSSDEVINHNSTSFKNATLLFLLLEHFGLSENILKSNNNNNNINK